MLLVDADIRRPSVHEIFRLNNKLGLTDVILGKIAPKEAIREEVMPYLDILSSGKPSADAVELLGAGAMAGLLTPMVDQYAIIIFIRPLS